MTRNLLLPGTPPATAWLPPARRRTTTAVLLPGPLGTLLLYTRRGPGRLRCAGAVISLEQLGRELRELPQPRTIVLCGRRHLDELAPVVLEEDDLYVVPPHWLADLRREDFDARAALAARLASAQRRGAIECLRAARQLQLPFQR